VIPRSRALQRIEETYRVHSVGGILGPRQCGKTTLARMYAEQRRAMYFDLEDPLMCAGSRRL
jgi:predicted AAA+ superfamily ATPase